jgi:hypothetical protein
MEEAPLVCMACGKTDRGIGIWSQPDRPWSGTKHDGLCPECCHERFPQFYDDYRPGRRRRWGLAVATNLFARLLKT